MSIPLGDRYTSFSDPRSMNSPNKLRSSYQQPCSCAQFLSFTNWTGLQAVVPARASISLRTRCATVDALSRISLSPFWRHSSSCDSRSELSPFIESFGLTMQRYELFSKPPNFSQLFQFVDNMRPFIRVYCTKCLTTEFCGSAVFVKVSLLLLTHLKSVY